MVFNSPESVGNVNVMSTSSHLSIDGVTYTRRHAEDLRLDTAMPLLVFNKILSYLSPAYLWHFVRLVNKAWKLAVEEYIPESLYSKAFIQLAVLRINENHPWSNRSYAAPHKNIKSAVYRVAELNDGLLTFLPMKKKYSITTYGGRSRRDWKLVGIESSIFPEPMTSNRRTVFRKKELWFDLPFWNPEPEEELDTPDRFVLQPQNLPETERSQSSSLKNIHQKPDGLFFDLQYRGYTLKCRYRPFDHGDDVNFSVERVEIKLSKFLQWRCGCPSPCSPDSLLAPPPRDLGQKSFRRRRRHPPQLQPSCPSLWPFSHVSYTKFLPLWNTQFSYRRRELLNRYPRNLLSFMRVETERFLSRHRVLPCAEKHTTQLPHSTSPGCSGGFCAYHCLDNKCKGHRIR